MGDPIFSPEIDRRLFALSSVVGGGLALVMVAMYSVLLLIGIANGTVAGSYGSLKSVTFFLYLMFSAKLMVSMVRRSLGDILR